MSENSTRLHRARAVALVEAVGLSCVVLGYMAIEIPGFGPQPIMLLLMLIVLSIPAGQRRLAKLDLDGPTHLVLNELALLAFFLILCSWRLYEAWTAVETRTQPWSRELVLVPRFQGLHRAVAVCAWGGSLGASLTVQPLLIRFYRSLQPVVEALAAERERAPAAAGKE